MAGMESPGSVTETNEPRSDSEPISLPASNVRRAIELADSLVEHWPDEGAKAIGREIAALLRPDEGRGAGVSSILEPRDGFSPCHPLRVVLMALQSCYGRWHDTHGFRWRDRVAEDIARELSLALGLDPDQLGVVQQPSPSPDGTRR